MTLIATPPSPPVPAAAWVDQAGKPTIEFARFVRDLQDWLATLAGFAYGQASVTFNGSGVGAIPHGLAAAPVFAAPFLVGDASGNEVTLTSLDATNLNLRARNSTTNAAVAGTLTVAWYAKT